MIQNVLLSIGWPWMITFIIWILIISVILFYGRYRTLRGWNDPPSEDKCWEDYVASMDNSDQMEEDNTLIDLYQLLNKQSKK